MTWLFSDVDFVLDTPLLAKVSTSDPNTAESADFLPGSMIRGSVAASLIAKGMNAESDTFYQMILSGSVRYLNAYPVIAGKRSIPVPLSWKIEKGTTSTGLSKVLDFTMDNVQMQGQPTNPPFGFATKNGAEWNWAQSGRTIRTHIARDRGKGKAWTETRADEEITHGALFSYESLSAHQLFRGTVQFRSEVAVLLRTLVPLLSGSLTMGRSRRGGYGLVHCTMHAQDAQCHRASEWNHEVPSRDVAAGQCFRVLCTSDCIVRNPSSGQFDSGAFPNMILHAFGQEADILPNRTFSSVGIAGGYNAKWGLPLQQSQTVVAGSVIVLRARQTITHRNICSLEAEGLGERLAEGFGRLLVEQIAIDQPSIDEMAVSHSLNRPSGDPPPLVLSIEARILKRKLHREIEAIASQETATPRNIPPNSLIERIRLPLHRGDDGLGVLRGWLEQGNCELRATAMKNLEKSRLGVPEVSLREWLLHRLDPHDQMLTGAIHLVASKFYLTDREWAENSLNRHRDELTLLLIDTVLAFLAKRGTQENAGSY